MIDADDLQTFLYDLSVTHYFSGHCEGGNGAVRSAGMDRDPFLYHWDFSGHLCLCGGSRQRMEAFAAVSAQGDCVSKV